MAEKEIEDADKYEKYRMLAACSFATVLIIIGVPLWWNTTEVYRVQLPYPQIHALKKFHPIVALNVHLATPDHGRSALLMEELASKFSHSSVFHIKFSIVGIPPVVFANAKTPALLEDTILKMNPVGVGDFIFIEWKKLSDQVLVTDGRSAYFAPGTGSTLLSQVLSKWILHEESLVNTLNSMKSSNAPSLSLSDTSTALIKVRDADQKPPDIDANLRRRIPLSAAYDILISVVNPAPEELRIDWDLETAIYQYLSPFLTELAVLANFTLKSQWLYLVPLDYHPKQVPDSSVLGRHYALPEDILPHLITPLEKKLSSQVSRNPSINLVVYAPSCKAAPLHIYNKQGSRVKSAAGVDAFLSPRWGGVVISNPPKDACVDALKNEMPITTVPDTAAIMGTFLHQLRLLLGIPTNEHIEGADIVELDSLAPRKWERDAILRVRALEGITSASLTLQSIDQLLGEINNIVINDEVGESIRKSLENIMKSSDFLNQGQLEAAVLASKDAFISSESAFTDPSLLALLYFPDDQKYAVYIPLFLPVMIPVMLSLGTIKKWLFPNAINETKEKVE